MQRRVSQGIKRALKSAASFAIVAAVAFFFYRAFEQNWSAIAAHDFEVNFWLLSPAVLAVVASYLLATIAWHISINALSSTSQLRFEQSFAAVNGSNLTKYLPGKIWSYALQIYWMNNAGFSKSLIVYVNLLNLFVSIITATILGLACLLVSTTAIPLGLVFAALLAAVAVDVASVKFYPLLFRYLVQRITKVLKREVRYFEPSTKLMLELHAIYLAASVASSSAVYLVSLGTGYVLAADQVLLVLGASLLSDVIGFLAFLAPGGLGVREGVMYLILGGAAVGSLPLVLPLASRAVNMFVDIAVGIVALRLLRRLSEPSRSHGGSATIDSFQE